MRFLLLALSVATLPVSAPACLAQDAEYTASAAQDLADLRIRAGATEEGIYLLNQVAAQLQSGNGMRDILGGLLNVSPDALGTDLRYELAGQVRLAQARAERYADILSNDLNGDGSVSRDEIADTLLFGRARRGGAAEMLISYDADRNDILSPDEIRQAVSDQRDTDGGRRDSTRIASILDLDSDGTLTVAELDRVGAALSLPEALQ